MNLFVALFSLAVIYVVSVQKEYIRTAYIALLLIEEEREIFRSDGRQEERRTFLMMCENEFSATKKKAIYDRRIPPRAQARKRVDTHAHQDENGQRGSRGVINIPRISDDQE